ncbi:MAG: ATP-binding protein [Pseudomarimonas sp.]
MTESRSATELSRQWRQSVALPFATLLACSAILIAVLSWLLLRAPTIGATPPASGIVLAACLCLLMTAVGVWMWLGGLARRESLRISEPLVRLARALAAIEIGSSGGARMPPVPTSASRDWIELYGAIEVCIQRAEAILISERRAADTLEASNRTLAAEAEARESYLEKQTKRLQEAMSATWQAAEAKTRMLTNTSHEIRTPLNGIIGTTELLLRSQPLSDSQRGLLRTQLGAAEALLALVDDILQLGQASSGLTLQPVPFDVAAEAAMVCGALQPLAGSRQIGLRVEIPRELHAARIGDRARIRQIMMGLVGNALKFTEQGEVVLELDDSEDLALLIRVRDSGIGIPADQFSRIFEAFYQVESQHTRRFAGTGLGLAIINEVVKAMDGRITVESTLGVGSTFCVQLPLEFADPSTLAVPVESNYDMQVQSNLRVLVVDDIEMNRELLELQVSSLGATTITAESGMRAIELIAENVFDLVLLDCQMPELDGYQTARRIRARWPQSPLRIVAVTAHAQPGERERCLRAGMDDYIAKPVAMATLERLLATTPVAATSQ